MSIGDMSVAGNRRAANMPADHERHVVYKELVFRHVAHALEQGQRFTRCDGRRNRRNIGRDPYEACFGERRGGPRLAASAAEPRHRRLVVDMVGPGQTHQQVDVEQVRQASSRAVRTISSVIGWAAGERGTPGSHPRRRCAAGVGPVRGGPGRTPPRRGPAVQRERWRGSSPRRRHRG